MTSPVEATAMGNLLTQVRASGELASLAEMRAVIRKSSDGGRFEPKETAVWQEGVERFTRLRSRVSH
jgi:rhamnulokinase